MERTDDVIQKVRFAHSHACTDREPDVANVHMKVVVRRLVVHKYAQLISLHAIALLNSLEHR